LVHLRVSADLNASLAGVAAVILAVRHSEYLELDPDEVVRAAGGAIAVVDCFGILDDDRIARYLELGCDVKGLGRGHIKRIKESLRKGDGAIPGVG
jgi:UDP-N-acetyl-D-mannosaminuronate dehydrogenase